MALRDQQLRIMKCIDEVCMGALGCSSGVDCRHLSVVPATTDLVALFVRIF